MSRDVEWATVLEIRQQYEIRKENGKRVWSQEKLAVRYNVSPTTLGRIIAGTGAFASEGGVEGNLTVGQTALPPLRTIAESQARLRQLLLEEQARYEAVMAAPEVIRAQAEALTGRKADVVDVSSTLSVLEKAELG